MKERRYVVRINVGESPPQRVDHDTWYERLICSWAMITQELAELLFSFRGAELYINTNGMNCIESLKFNQEWSLEKFLLADLETKSCVQSRYHTLLPPKLEISISSPNSFEKLHNLEALQTFIESFYLTCNIFSPGILSIISITTDEGNIHDCRLSGNFFREITETMEHWGWPRLSKSSPWQVWNWLSNINFHSSTHARNGAENALIALLQMNDLDDLHAIHSSTMIISQALEKVLQIPDTSKAKNLAQHITAILGEPPNDKKFISRFYNLRSRLVHGTIPLIRPGWMQYESREISDFVYPLQDTVMKAAAALLGIVHDLSSSGCVDYKFSTTVGYERIASHR